MICIDCRDDEHGKCPATRKGAPTLCDCQHFARLRNRKPGASREKAFDISEQTKAILESIRRYQQRNGWV